MKLTAPQTAEKLNISIAQLNTLVAHGKLKPINGPKEGKKRFNRFFDSVDVNKYKSENGERAALPVAAPADVTREHEQALAEQLCVCDPIDGVKCCDRYERLGGLPRG